MDESLGFLEQPSLFHAGLSILLLSLSDIDADRRSNKQDGSSTGVEEKQFVSYEIDAVLLGGNVKKGVFLASARARVERFVR